MRLPIPVDLHQHIRWFSPVLSRIRKTSRIQHHKPVLTVLQMRLVGMAKHDNIHLSGSRLFLDRLQLKRYAVHVTVSQKCPVFPDGDLLLLVCLGKEIIISARYMGEKTSYEIKNWNLIHRLDGVPEEKRTARFVCVIAAVLPDGRTLTAEGTMEGVIAHEPAGAGGFGYDPILMLPEYGKTSAEITMDEKNAISHRGKALRAMKKCLAEEIGE